MSGKFDEKSSNMEDVFKKGHVKGLKKLFESNCADQYIRNSKSSLWINKDSNLTDKQLTREDSKTRHIDNGQKRIAKQCLYENETKKFTGNPFYSELNNNHHKTDKTYGKSEEHKYTSLAVRKFTQGTTAEKDESNKNMTLKNSNTITYNKSVTGTLSRVLPKKPVPSPRTHTLSRKEPSVLNTEIPQNDGTFRDGKNILKTTFFEADRRGYIEEFRKTLLGIIDEEIIEMEADGYDYNRNKNDENLFSNEESNQETDSEKENSSADAIMDEPMYINFVGLLGCNKVENKYELNEKNIEEISNENTGCPMYENISNHTVANITSGDHIKKEKETSSADAIMDEPMYNNFVGLLGCNKVENNYELNEKNIEEISNKNTGCPMYENISNHTVTNITSGDHIKKELDWNIQPVPDRSLKPPTTLEKTKNITSSTSYDESDDENYEPIDIYMVQAQSKQAITQETLKNHQSEDENTINTQSNKLSKIIQEFKETEKRYIQELNDIVPVYKFGIKNHSSLEIKCRATLICAFVDKLLKMQSEFSRLIGKPENSIVTILQCFIDFEELFITYKQCLGITDSITVILGYIENEAKKEVNLPSILSQRLTHYQMFLERIKNEGSKHQDFQLQLVLCPLNTVMKILSSCNVLLLLATVRNIPLQTNKFGSLSDVREAPSSLFLQCCPFDISGYGDFLLKDRFKIRKPFSMELIIFLFNNIIIFTLEKQKEEFYYYSHIKMRDVLLRALSKRDYLELQHFRKSKQFHSPTNYKLKADPKIVEKWRNTIQKCLSIQQLNIKETAQEYGQTASKFYVE